LAFSAPTVPARARRFGCSSDYIPPTSGTARVAGCDIVAEPVSARQHIVVVPEEASAYADLSVWQNIMLMGELHSIRRRRRIERGAELIDLFGLADRRDQKGRDLSNGLRQRLMLSMAPVSDPEIRHDPRQSSTGPRQKNRLVHDLNHAVWRQSARRLRMFTLA
jgi:ABC-type lipopolysaccharide export system ATPase subunit